MLLTKDDNVTPCLLIYLDFKETCKVIAIDLSKWKAFYADTKALQ